MCGIWHIIANDEKKYNCCLVSNIPYIYYNISELIIIVPTFFYVTCRSIIFQHIFNIKNTVVKRKESRMPKSHAKLVFKNTFYLINFPSNPLMGSYACTAKNNAPV